MGEALPDVLQEQGNERPREGTGAGAEAEHTDPAPTVTGKAAERPSRASGGSPPPLPTQKTRTGVALEDKTVLLYGPHGIGKSTLASEWAGGGAFFFDTAGELNDIEVFRQRIISWDEFRSYCWSLERNPGQFPAACIDTVDVLGMFVSQHIRKKLGIMHESDEAYGKAWSMVRDEFAATLAKLAGLPGGLILVAHAKEVEIKTRTATYNKAVPTLTGGVREVCLNLPDLVLHVDWAEDDARVIHTKPGPYWEAKERGREPRLPAAIPWPLGRSGYDVLKEAWEAGGK